MGRPARWGPRGKITACSLLVAGLLLLGAPLSWAEDADRGERPPPLPLDESLLAWVRGEANYEWHADFHRIYPSSPHKQDSEEFEVSAKAYVFRRDNPAEKVRALVEGLLARHAAEETSPEARVRVLYVLGRLATANGLDLLCRSAGSEDHETALTALRSLAMYGREPYRECFLIFGGSLRWVVHPATPSELATQTLCRVLREDPPRWIEGEDAAVLRTRFDQWRSRRYGVVRALASHRGARVVETVIDELLRTPHPVRGLPRVQSELVEVLVANTAHVLPEHLERLRGSRDNEENAIRVRNLASAALQQLADPEPKKPQSPGVYRH